MLVMLVMMMLGDEVEIWTMMLIMMMMFVLISL
jgi:hypothetical protein